MTPAIGADEPLADWERDLLKGEADKAAVAATGGDVATEDTPAAESTGAATEAAVAAEVEPAEAPLEAPIAEDATVVETKDEDAPFGADSAKAAEDGSGPEGFEIKGNADSMKFHAPTSPWYSRTKAEVWFKTAEAAEAAGFVNAEAAKADDAADDKN